MNIQNSINEFKRAQESIPGGVNSPVRAFKSVHGDPIFIKQAKGARITDIDGNEYIDFVSSWGPMILGHADERVINAIQMAAVHGTSYGAPTIAETELAELIKRMVPSMELVRMVNSGTEATMSALRLARGYTGRDVVIKFQGCYHGHADSFLIKAGSGVLTFGYPDSPGVTQGTAKDTLIAQYNDLSSVEEIFKQKGDQVAAIIVEPVPANMGVFLPESGFLEGLRKITIKYGALLIFDEVISGFRLAKGGAQEYYGVIPDITTLGKIIGGGLPVGAYGGKREIMNRLAPTGPVYQAGTLAGNPLAMSAGLETLKIIDETPGFYNELDRKGALLENGLRQNLQNTGIPGIINRIGSLMTLFFTGEKKVDSYNTAIKSDTTRYARYFKLALENGIYLAPSQFEAAFVSYAHTNEDIKKAQLASLAAMKMLKTQ
ncbi:MAG: glutamate-1-semialdehyde-2,1-aminomutase [Bacteroidetes bacterium GWE2_41_25]|nr:MAG: glutamate-1-semialdehyde-2,1-aminomutase [Bacteroidetes bacterium GWA2_40_15]OFX91847.1 MAG: glutamate-1-semialdehyde-2,1-aminomutase [Bacteroidetes bacterium GWE2_41_25]OFX94099.1 MAG: glutamate-1-semialdehyde-2,1-aminomutase [Bacteroidetes bacterium GWC2_40_22]OFY58617.1 MAG: glutamate-1-semialdehyde-2,1-aminomutase [Bacteroidetes bacterium GWF2_41_9]HBH85524.1 glutamate-1-semialdehyde-2,1-aminomutase [Bacteroidales bacterium]HCT84650.1 glutamate-1-semialdehyde-2,1-aminomutase [Candi